MTRIDDNLDALERFFRSAVPGCTVTRISECDQQGLGPHAVTFAIADGDVRWLVTVQSDFVRDLRIIPRTPRLQAAVALIGEHPRGCHISLGLNEAIMIRSRISEPSRRSARKT